MAAFPDVPEAITGGKDRTEALTMAEDALATALVGMSTRSGKSPRLANRVPARSLSQYQPCSRPNLHSILLCASSA